MTKIKLPEVSLFCIDAFDPEGAKRAIEICQRGIEFGDVICITDHNYFRGRESYSKFMVERINEFIKTDFVLTCHPDGFIQNPEAWDNDWLQYDYIGATWDFYNHHQNGNGGFSLRSKKLLQILSELNLDGINVHPEDDFICRQIRDWLEKEYHIKFAPVEVCKKFSIEAYAIMPPYNRWNGEFGHHGYYVTGLPIPNMPRKTTITKQKMIRK